jgi:hypothetical protein
MCWRMDDNGLPCLWPFVLQKFDQITICDMQLEDMDVQCVFWRKLNDVMFKHYGINFNFKCFTVNSAQAN